MMVIMLVLNFIITTVVQILISIEWYIYTAFQNERMQKRSNNM